MMLRLIATAAAAAAMLMPAAARAEWREAETAHFQIYSDGSESQLVEYAQRLEGVGELLRKATATAADLPPSKVRVILFPTVAQVRHAYHGHDRDIAGFYTVNMQGPLAISTRGQDKNDENLGPDVILFHEYAHHFMLEYFPATYPAWYVEGYAELIGSSKIQPDGKIAYGFPAKHRGHDIAAEWMPLDELFLTPP